MGWGLAVLVLRLLSVVRERFRVHMKILSSVSLVVFLVLLYVSPGACGCHAHLGATEVLAVCEDRAENLWFGTTNGAMQYDGVAWRTYTTADGLAHNRVNAIIEDDSGALWFGTAPGSPTSRAENVAYSAMSSSEIAQSIRSDVGSFCRGQDYADDVTIVVVRKR